MADYGLAVFKTIRKNLEMQHCFLLHGLRDLDTFRKQITNQSTN